MGMAVPSIKISGTAMFGHSYYIKDGQSPKNRNVRIIAGIVCSFECCTYCLCSYTKLAVFVVCFFVNESRKMAGLRKPYFTRNRFSAFYISYTYGINLRIFFLVVDTLQ